MPTVDALVADALRLSHWLILLTLLFAPLERLFALRRRPGGRRLLSDVGYFYLNGWLPTVVLAVPLGVLAAVAHALTPDSYRAGLADLPFAMKAAAGLVAAELGSYWAHRGCHASPALWRFHAIHHAPVHLGWMVATRAHPVDFVLTRLAALGPIFLLGLSGGAEGQRVAVVVLLAQTAGAFVAHANVRWRFGWLEQAVALPAFHHWHHTNCAHRDRNFAVLFPWIDRLHGTLHLPPRDWPPCYGIDAPGHGSMTGELVGPFLPPEPAAPPGPAAPSPVGL